MNSMLRVSRALLLGLPLVALSAAAFAGDVCDIQGVTRVVAVGDVHGAYHNFVAVLQMTGIVDEEARWVGGETHLVQTGDLLDNGDDTRQVLDLVMRLEKEARQAGGGVHALIGNHEVMNLLGDLRHVTSGEYETFRTPRSVEIRERFYKWAVGGARQRAEEAGEEFDEKDFRARFEKEAPLGFVERQQALSAEGEYGKWLRERHAVTKINGVVFLHGGISPAVAPLGCAGINETVHRELTEEYAQTREDPLASLAARVDGPLWYRGLAREDEATFTPALESILEAMGARAIVVGHTVAKTGRIQSRFGGRVVLIDAGMAPAYGNGRAALEIGPDGKMTAIYPDAREVIERRAADLTDPGPARRAGGSRRPRPATVP